MNRKIAHFYWGAKTLPYLRYLTIVSFARYNPDWEIRFYCPKLLGKETPWDSHEQKYVLNSNETYDMFGHLKIKTSIVDFEEFGLSNALSEVHKSDIFRWKVLWEVGGLWSDMDILYFKPVPEFKDDIGLCQNPRYGHSIGFLFANKVRSDLFHWTYKMSKQNLDERLYQTAGSLLLNRLYPNLSKIPDKYNESVYNIPMNLVYPLDALRIQEIYGNGAPEFGEETIGLHWYAGHQLAGDFMNGKYRDCLLAKLMRKEGYDVR